MGVYTKFCCDKCGKEWLWTDKGRPQEVNLSMTLCYGEHNPPSDTFSGVQLLYQVWCRPCIDAAGIISPVNEVNANETPAMTPEQLIALGLEQLGFKREP